METSNSPIMIGNLKPIDKLNADVSVGHRHCIIA